MIELECNYNKIRETFSLVISGTVPKSQPIKAQCVHYFYRPIAKPEHELCISRVNFLVILQ